MKGLEGLSDSPFIPHLCSFLCFFIFMCLLLRCLCSLSHRANVTTSHTNKVSLLLPLSLIFPFFHDPPPDSKGGDSEQPYLSQMLPHTTLKKSDGQVTKMSHSLVLRGSSLDLGRKGDAIWGRHSTDVTYVENAVISMAGAERLKSQALTAVDSSLTLATSTAPRPQSPCFLPAVLKYNQQIKIVYI